MALLLASAKCTIIAIPYKIKNVKMYMIGIIKAHIILKYITLISEILIKKQSKE